ncbi:MAG: GumC family protein [Wenzhouxiangella sp.]
MSERPEQPGRHLKPVDPTQNALAQFDPFMGDQRQDDETIDLLVLWNAVRKRKWIVASILIFAVAVGILQTLLTVPMYSSTAVVQINHEGQRILRIEDFEATPRSWQGVEQFYQTQFEIIRGRQLAEDVVRRLEIWDHPEFTGEIRQRSLMGELQALPYRLRAVFRRSNGGEDRAVDPDVQREMAIRRAGAVLRGRINVNQRPNSRLVNVSVSAFDNRFAAQLANAVVAEYIRSSMQRRYDAGQEAREFLESQLDDMRIALERSDQALLDFAQANQVADLRNRIEMATTGLRALNSQLDEAERQLLRLSTARELIEQNGGANIRLVTEDEQIRALQRQRSEMATEMASLSQRFREDFPAIVELRTRMETVDAQIAERRQAVINGVLNEYNNLSAEIENLRQASVNREQQILALNQQGVQYNILRRDFETSRELYDGMLQRLREIGVASGMQENNVAMIDQALVAGRPFMPNTQRTMAMAIAVGLALGVGLAMMLEFLDNTIRRVEDLERFVGRPVLGLIPIVKQRDQKKKSTPLKPISDRAVSHYSEMHPKSAVSEAFRSLRTSLMFSTPEGMPKTLLVTSPGPGDGKTTSAINLATVMAQNGARVLLIDADLRKPRLHRDFGIPHAPGLTNRIAGAHGDDHSQSAIVPTTVEGLFVMPSGNQAPNPAELLSSERMRKIIAMASRAFDHVLVDCSPILGLADALVLSRTVDGVVMVMSAGKTTKDSIKTSTRRLRQVQAPLLGVVMNRVDLDSPDYAYYSSYYYNYSGDEDPIPAEDEKPRALGAAG